jgi:superfamily II DNA or RNA helicase
VPPPPGGREPLLAWAAAHGVADRLDDNLIGAGEAWGRALAGRPGESWSYRQVLIEGPPPRHHEWDRERRVQVARGLLLRMARLLARHCAWRARLAAEGRDPEDPALAAFLARLCEAHGELTAAGAAPARPPGTFEPVGVRVVRGPVPLLSYRERPLTVDYEEEDEEDDADQDASDDLAPGSDDLDEAGARDLDEHHQPLHGEEQLNLALLGWDQGGPPRWTHTRDQPQVQLRGDIAVSRRKSALAAMIDFVRDPRQAAAQEQLAELLRQPSWQFALGNLDERLTRLAGEAALAGGAAADTRVAFRVWHSDGAGVGVEPVVQKRGRNGFSRGARLQWYQLADRKELTAADRRAYQAYDDRFARAARGGWEMGGLTVAQTHGVLRALIDHPAVFLSNGDPQRVPKPPHDGSRRAEPGDSPRDHGERDGARLDIRQGRLRLRFGTAGNGDLAPQFELAGVTLLAPEVGQALRDDRHLIHLHRPARGGPQLLLAQISAQAAAVVRALALAPGQFPPESHDALAARLEALQETMDIEFPSQWTRTIGAADGRLVARLELLASGALELHLGVRPVKLGPLFPPGEGPALLLEGEGRERHGARRDLQGERQAGHALGERLGLNTAAAAASDSEPWCWRVNEGDPALHVVATLKELGAEVTVEWADDARLLALGSVDRRSMRLKVADKRDWFAVEGGAEIGGQVVPLYTLLAAIREGRRYVPVGARGFARIEDSLREALARAEAVTFDHRDALEIPMVGSDPLVGLVEAEAQIQASAAFTALRRRMREGEAVTAALPPALAEALRPYQRAGVDWLARLAHWGAGAVLADEMGLGKTIQTLAVLSHRAASGPALVVAPTSVVMTWLEQAARFAPGLRVLPYRGAERAPALRNLGPGDLLVTSYGIATLDAAALAAIPFATLVLDEAQAVKNATTDRARALRDLQAGWRLALTGTPIENHLGELWSLLRVISPGLLGSWEQFRGRYAVPIEKYGDEARRRALAGLLRPFILRRTKAEVAPELPPRTEIVRAVGLSAEEAGLYEQLRASTLAELEAAKQDPERDARDMRFTLLAALTRLRQLCCHPRLVYPRTQAGSTKAAHLLELLAELREGGHKALVFSQFRRFLELLAPRLRQHGHRVLVLDGTTPPETREQRIAAFQRGEADVFLISLKAGGFGLNLTAADTVIHLDPWWNPAVEDQATARAHRIGQHRPVTAVRLVAQGTIEQAVLSLHAAKRALAAGVLEGTDMAARLGTDELIGLIRGGG